MLLLAAPHPLPGPRCFPIVFCSGYVDILPVEVMREKGAHTIIAVDVSSREARDLNNYGDELSGWWLLWRKLNPFLSMPKVG